MYSFCFKLVILFQHKYKCKVVTSNLGTNDKVSPLTMKVDGDVTTSPSKVQNKLSSDIPKQSTSRNSPDKENKANIASNLFDASKLGLSFFFFFETFKYKG